MENSSIGWTNHTFNPWRGCQKVSEGCKLCYAESNSNRNQQLFGKWGLHGFRVVASEQMWKEPLKWDRKCCESGTRQRVFCASLADVFEDWDGPVRRHDGCTMWECSQCGSWLDGAIPDIQLTGPTCHGQCKPLTVQAIRSRLFALIDQTPNLDWLLVTKRPENIVRMWPTCRVGEDREVEERFIENVWLLTSVENQKAADTRIPELLKCRHLAPVLGVSFEPLLDKVELSKQLLEIDWGIIGGESDRKGRQRVMPLDDAMNLADQLADCGIPVYVKQDSAREDGQQGRWPDEYWNLKQFPKVSN